MIVGPAVAGLLLTRIGPAWLIALDAASFAYLGLQAWRIPHPFIPLTYAIFQSSATTGNLASMLAARSALTVIATPLGTVVGGPLVGAIGAAATLAASGVATIVLAGVTGFVWRGHLRPRRVLRTPWRPADPGWPSAAADVQPSRR